MVHGAWGKAVLHAVRVNCGPLRSHGLTCWPPEMSHVFKETLLRLKLDSLSLQKSAMTACVEVKFKGNAMTRKDQSVVCQRGPRVGG